MENFKEDEILGKFITYMDLVLEHVKIDYLKKLRKINYYEEELNEDKKYKEFEFVMLQFTADIKKTAVILL